MHKREPRGHLPGTFVGLLLHFKLRVDDVFVFLLLVVGEIRRTADAIGGFVGLPRRLSVPNLGAAGSRVALLWVLAWTGRLRTPLGASGGPV